MTLNDFSKIISPINNSSEESEESFSIPLDISDIIRICKEYNKLGMYIQQQVENILEVGVEESIRSGFVKKESLPHIKNFLRCICRNPYFGDAIDQAQNCIQLITEYEDKYKITYTSKLN